MALSWLAGCGERTDVEPEDAGAEVDAGAAIDGGLDAGVGLPDAGPGAPEDAGPLCGNGALDDGEECDDGNTSDFDGCRSDCTEVELIVPTDERTWELFEIEGARCMNGDPAGFGVSYVADAPGVMIYLEGGGACFDDTCDFTAFSLPFVPPGDGIFNRSRDRNPVRDWTMIYVPYCTGDIHAGDAEAELGGSLRQFRGYSNIRRFLERWVPSFPTNTVLLTGISAGGFGAALNASQVADAYGDGTQLVMLDDSGPPLSDDVIAPCLQQRFRDTWGLDGTVLAACPTCDPTDFATDLFTHVVTSYPTMRLGLFSNTGDFIIRTYMGFGWGGGTHDDCAGTATPVPRDTYSFDLAAIRLAHEERLSTYYVTGIGHTVLRGPGFYTTREGGAGLPEWTAGLIDGAHAHVGP